MESKLYHGAVTLKFNPNSTKYRYMVQDSGKDEVSVRGVTSVLKDIIAKPALMTWPMNMSHKFLFGATWNEDLLKNLYNPEKACIKAGEAYTEEQLQEFLDSGAKQYRQRQDQGADIGKVVHKLVENYLRGQYEGAQPVSLEEAWEDSIKELELQEWDEKEAKMAHKAFKAFVDFWDNLRENHNAFIVALERPVYSRQLKFCGTLDICAKIDGKIYILDIKTTNTSDSAPLGIYAENFVQLGGYSLAYDEEEVQIDEVHDVGVIRVGKDGKLNVVTARDMNLSVDQCKRSFAFAIRLHDLLNQTAAFLADPHFKSSLITASKVDKEVA